jgi:hypothetical protein
LLIFPLTCRRKPTLEEEVEKIRIEMGKFVAAGYIVSTFEEPARLSWTERELESLASSPAGMKSNSRVFSRRQNQRNVLEIRKVRPPQGGIKLVEGSCRRGWASS